MKMFGPSLARLPGFRSITADQREYFSVSASVIGLVLKNYMYMYLVKRL